MPGLGHKAYVQFGGREATYGTFQVPTKRLEILNWNVTPVIGSIMDGSMSGNPSRRGIYQSGQLFRGTFSCRVNYEGLEELFRNAFGSYARTVVSGNTGDHTFREGSTLSPMTLEVNLGDVPSSGRCFRLLGAKLTGLTIKGAAGSGNDGMLTVEFTVVARDYLSDQTPTAAVTLATVVTCIATGVCTLTKAAFDFAANGVVVGSTVSHPSYAAGTVVTAVVVGTVTLSGPANAALVTATAVFSTMQPSAVIPVLYTQALTVSDGTADAAASVRVRSFEVSLESPHAEDRWFVGSVNIDEPLRSDFLAARFKLTQEFTTKTQHDAARAFTKGSPKLLFRHSEALLSTNFREFELRANQANLVEFGAPVEGFGVMLSTATWEAWFDTTDATALLARFRNDLPALP